MGPYRRSLDVIRIASPCAERWDRMEGDHRARFCRTCQSHVYALAELTMEEAWSLLELLEGTACVTLRRRADGTVVTKDCTQDRRVRRLRRWRGAAAALVSIAGSTALAALLVGAAPEPREAPRRAPAIAERPRETRTPAIVEHPMETHTMGAFMGTLRPREPTWIDPSTLESPFPPDPCDPLCTW